MNNKLTKNNTSWNAIFRKYNIINELDKKGIFEITAEQINEFREARLMTKFDTKSSLPEIFIKNKLSILPITRGNYVIAPFDTFHKFPKDEDISAGKIIYDLQLPECIHSISKESITTEAMAINCAYLSGILHDFIGEEELYSTINGRMSSDSFSFNIKSTKVSEELNLNVTKAQIEVDGGYEGLNTLSLIEAKLNFSNDFMIRQLYYPFRKWYGKINKTVKNIFMIYSNNVYYLFEYIFQDPTNYNSLELGKIQRYSFEKSYIDLTDIQDLINNTNEISESQQVPFPQADSFLRIINLCETLLNNSLTKKDITDLYGFDKRQTDYYINAGKYLGLCQMNEQLVELTHKANEIFNEYNTRNRQLELVKLILQHRIFKDALVTKLKNGGLLSSDVIIQIMEKYPEDLIDIKANTLQRRALTIKSWITWVVRLINDE